MFTPTPHFPGFAELNAQLALRCKELAGRKPPEQTGRTVADCFAAEQPFLTPIKAEFDGYVDKTMRVSSTCLPIKVDHNRYSVPADWANRVVSVRLTAGRLRLVADGQVIAQNDRRYWPQPTVVRPLPLFAHLREKPGALRHGAPFQQWDLPTPIRIVRDRILKQDKGDRSFVELLLMASSIGETGLETLEVACDLTLQTGIIAAAIVLNEMYRLTGTVYP